MIIVWEIEDGYMGKSRPHKVKIDDDELKACSTIEQQEKLIDETVQSEFENTIYPYWNRTQLDKCPPPEPEEEMDNL